MTLWSYKDLESSHQHDKGVLRCTEHMYSMSAIIPCLCATDYQCLKPSASILSILEGWDGLCQSVNVWKEQQGQWQAPVDYRTGHDINSDLSQILLLMILFTGCDIQNTIIKDTKCKTNNWNTLSNICTSYIMNKCNWQPVANKVEGTCIKGRNDKQV